MRLSASRYFTAVLLVFLASFLVLPGTKAVNNVFYVFLAMPALVMLLLGKAQRPPMTALLGIWAAFFAWMALYVIGVEIQLFRHFLYTALFCAAVWLWVDWHCFDNLQLFRVFFWSLITYVIGSAVFYWLTGQVDVGERVLLLPSRMEGPILTSMLIVSCFALLLPEWLRNRHWLEMSAGFLAVLFCAGFVLQSRTGLVGVFVLLAAMYVWVFWRADWLGRSAALLSAALLLLAGVGVFQYSDVAAELVDRADSARFELWQQYFSHWLECGPLLGCGVEYMAGVRIFTGELVHHPHNIFLAIGFRYGVPGLVLFILAMLTTLWQAWKQRNPWGGYLMIALFMLNFDGRELISSPHEVWLLVLLPSMLIAAQQRDDRRHRV